MAPRLYERNSSLYWHRDTPAVVTGSCTYYAHPEWNVQWGGELFIAHPSARDIPERNGPSMISPKEVMGRGLVQLSGHLDNSEVNEALMAAGMGHYVMPKPNRLVVMKTGNPHMITQGAARRRRSRPRQRDAVPDPPGEGGWRGVEVILTSPQRVTCGGSSSADHVAEMDSVAVFSRTLHRSDTSRL